MWQLLIFVVDLFWDITIMQVVTNGSSINCGDTIIGKGARINTTLSEAVGWTGGGEVLNTLTNYEIPTHNHCG